MPCLYIDILTKVFLIYFGVDFWRIIYLLLDWEGRRQAGLEVSYAWPYSDLFSYSGILIWQ